MISVVIPTYNEEKNIERCLLALEKQTLPRHKYEIIVVDGQSRDRTVEIAKKYADKVIMQKSKGVGGARNDGVAVAKYDLIATTDADCLVTENWLEIIQINFNRNKNAVGIYGPIKPIEKKLKYRLFLTINNTITYILYLSRLAYTTVGANTAFKNKSQYEIFKEITKNFENVIVMKEDSKNINFSPEEKFMFCFIDGNHTSEYVMNDFYKVWTNLVPGGVIGFHDYNGDIPDVTKAVDHLIEKHKNEIEEVYHENKESVLLIVKNKSVSL